MRLAWTTDIHLDFLNQDKIKRFCDDILALYPEAVVITGDLSQARVLQTHLQMLEQFLDPVPVFFVCGNHDYYMGSISNMRETLKDKYTYPEYEKGGMYKGTYWLGSSGVVPLTTTTAIVGHDGWYDGLYADYYKSRVDLNDYYVIQELSPANNSSKIIRHNRIKELSAESARYVHTQIKEAFGKGFKNVYVATHIPPFRENSVYRDKISDDDWMPHFSSKIMGDMLLEIAKTNPDKHIVVLCGHSHGKAFHQPLPNLEVHTGEAEYREPKVVQVFNIDQ